MLSLTIRLIYLIALLFNGLVCKSNEKNENAK